MNREKFNEVRKTIFFTAILVLALMYSTQIFAALSFVLSVMKPFVIGGVIAFVFNIPVSSIEKRFLKKMNGRILGKIKRTISIVASIIIVALIITFVLVALVPALTSTVMDVAERVPSLYDKIIKYVDKYPFIMEYTEKIGVENLNWDAIIDYAMKFFESGWAGNIVMSTVGMASSVASGVVDTGISIIFAIYLLASKDYIIRNAKTVCRTYLTKDVFKYVEHATVLLIENFKNYLTGQLKEACILGTIIAVVLMCFRMPYVILISVVIALTALIPIAGAFIGAFVGAFLILLVSPIKMLQFLIIFIIVQQIETQLIYPRVVGSSVGLPAVWVFMAVMVGGSLFGVPGMLAFIPITSTGYTLLKEDVIKKEKKRKELEKRRNKRNRKYNKE